MPGCQVQHVLHRGDPRDPGDKTMSPDGPCIGRTGAVGAMPKLESKVRGQNLGENANAGDTWKGARQSRF